MTSASAAGKIILFGEHAVVYGRPALAVPVSQIRATATVTKDPRGGVWIEAPDIGLSAELTDLPAEHPLAAAVKSVFSTLEISQPAACKLHIRSTIPVASGLGSGAAVSVAVLRAFSAYLGHPFSDKQVNRLAYEIEKLHHGTPSGIDNTVITYERPVYFVKGQPVETLRVGASFTILIGDTGISSPTKIAVGDVRKLWEADPPRWEKVFDAIGGIAKNARAAIEAGDSAALGPLMEENHRLLQELTVSSPELDRLVEAAHASGALGAKLSGGGRGGNMIALIRVEEAEKVARALDQAGATRTLLATISP
jgi:mevalonate kinase